MNPRDHDPLAAPRQLGTHQRNPLGRNSARSPRGHGPDPSLPTRRRGSCRTAGRPARAALCGSTSSAVRAASRGGKACSVSFAATAPGSPWTARRPSRSAADRLGTVRPRSASRRMRRSPAGTRVQRVQPLARATPSVCASLRSSLRRARDAAALIRRAPSSRCRGPGTGRASWTRRRPPAGRAPAGAGLADHRGESARASASKASTEGGGSAPSSRAAARQSWPSRSGRSAAAGVGRA